VDDLDAGFPDKRSANRSTAIRPRAPLDCDAGRIEARLVPMPTAVGARVGSVRPAASSDDPHSVKRNSHGQPTRQVHGSERGSPVLSACSARSAPGRGLGRSIRSMSFAISASSGSASSPAPLSGKDQITELPPYVGKAGGARSLGCVSHRARIARAAPIGQTRLRRPSTWRRCRWDCGRHGVVWRQPRRRAATSSMGGSQTLIASPTSHPGRPVNVSAHDHRHDRRLIRVTSCSLVARMFRSCVGRTRPLLDSSTTQERRFVHEARALAGCGRTTVSAAGRPRID
jgi:hypothetical protein